MLLWMSDIHLLLSCWINVVEYKRSGDKLIKCRMPAQQLHVPLAALTVLTGIIIRELVLSYH